jgi:class 3 adenylate cyclase
VELVDEDFPRRPKVLVVDDDRLNRDLVAAFFTHLGADVTPVPDARQALERAAADPPDLIIMDLAMPGMDGVEATRALKDVPATRFIPIIMLTVLDSDAERIRALQAGADDFITKPYTSLLLLTRARALLKLKRLNDQLAQRTELLRSTLSRYMAPEVAEAILQDPERRLRLGGESRAVTVLFADIRGFTRFTEQHTAAQVVAVLNRVFAALTPVVFKHHGTFDKYLGDAIMAFYGAPLTYPDDALRAVRTALEMQMVFARLPAEAPDLAGLGLGIGLHTGDATVGNVGVENAMDYTVIGDTVNVARRLTEDAQAGQILISQAVYDAVRARIRALPLGARPIRGRREAVAVWEVEGI